MRAGVLLGCAAVLLQAPAHGENITQLIDATGEGVHAFDDGEDIAVDGAGNVYVTGRRSDNAFKITPGGVITQLIDASGDGVNPLGGLSLARRWCVRERLRDE